MITQPTLIPKPFADSGNANTIPETMATPDTSAAASWNLGFPPITATPLASGGFPPAREDFNGVLKALSEHLVWLQSGNLYQWSSDMDYFVGAHVIGSNNKEYVAIAASGPKVPSGGGFIGAKDPTSLGGIPYWQIFDPLQKAGGTMTGTIVCNANPAIIAGVGVDALRFFGGTSSNTGARLTLRGATGAGGENGMFFLSAYKTDGSGEYVNLEGNADNDTLIWGTRYIVPKVATVFNDRLNIPQNTPTIIPISHAADCHLHLAYEISNVIPHTTLVDAGVIILNINYQNNNQIRVISHSVTQDYSIKLDEIYV